MCIYDKEEYCRQVVNLEKRYTWNLALLSELKEKIEQYPEQRFEQILYNMGLCEDHFYEEPWETYTRISKESSI